VDDETAEIELVSKVHGYLHWKTDKTLSVAAKSGQNAKRMTV